MYSSLQTIDIVVQEKAGKGTVFVQTDHRAAEEVAAAVEISVLFALARILAPKRMKDGAGATVRYVCMESMHPALVEVIASTGAEAEAKGESVSLEGVHRRAPADIADGAFAALGKRLLAEHELAADEAGLAAFVAHVANERGDEDEEDDEIGHWTAVAKLAAVTGEVLRAKYGGRWVDDPRDFADIPFMFRPAGEAGLLNAVSKAVKFLKHGDAESPCQLLRLVEDSGSAEGPLLFTLKPSTWGTQGESVCEPVASDMAKSGGDIPVIVYGRDQPQTFALFLKDGKREKDIPTLRTEALANLAKIEVTVERVDVEQLTFWVVHGSYFAAEKIADVSFMKSMHERLKTPLLAAAIPAKGRLLVTNAVAGPELIGGFLTAARGIYERNEGGRQLSPTVFLIAEGKIVGVAATTSTPEPPKQEKGFLKRLVS